MEKYIIKGATAPSMDILYTLSGNHIYKGWDTYREIFATVGDNHIYLRCPSTRSASEFFRFIFGW